MDLKARIEKHLNDYMALRTPTNTPLENKAQDYFVDWFSSMEYFSKRPSNYGLYDIEGDKLERKVPWALIKGRGPKTLVLIHHSDMLDLEELSDKAWDSNKMEELLRARISSLSDEAREDLESGDWLFGRALADMRAGAAIQMALFEDYSREELEGNILFLALPDEANLSAGMGAALLLMEELAQREDLDYFLMLNSQPHERKHEYRPLIHDGSVGKIMPLIYVKGSLSHASEVFTGFNPLVLLSEIVRRTQGEEYFMERVGKTTTPPASWLYLRDRKTSYDVSLAPAGVGYMNILTLNRTPSQVFKVLERIIGEAIKSVEEDIEASLKKYEEISGEKLTHLAWQVKQLTYGELYSQALRDSGESFLLAYRQLLDELGADISRPESATKVVEKTLAYVNEEGPIVVLGLAPPYYPNVNNRFLGDFAAEVDELVYELQVYSRRELKQKLDLENYYMGISDLSYALFLEDSENIRFMDYNMLLWRDGYYMPLDKSKKLSMAVLNLGPWGKDVYKRTERVYKKDLYETTPALMDWLIRKVVG